MNQEVLVKAVVSQLDALEKIFSWAIILAIAVAWAGVRRATHIEALGLKFLRREAFYAVSALFLVANVAVLILLLRIGDLLWIVDDKHFAESLTNLATHSWVLNPFSYFGSSAAARLTSGEGFGLLIVVRWLCNASISTLLDTQTRKSKMLLGLFLFVGLSSMVAIERVYRVALIRSVSVDNALYQNLAATKTERTIGTWLGITVGGLTFASAKRLQSRMRKAPEQIET
jgi:hypothetical protein